MRAADDKEKCCLESRSWLNLGHPDDGACTFSTILLFLLSALPRVRSPPRVRRNNTFSLSLSRSFPLSIHLSCAYSSFSYSPLVLPSFYPSAFLLSVSPCTSLLFHRSPPSLFLPLFSPPDTIQGSSSGGRPDANRRKKEREREDRGTVMPARARAPRDLQIAKARTSLTARCLNSTLVRNFVCEMSRWRRVGVLQDRYLILLCNIRISSFAPRNNGKGFPFDKGEASASPPSIRSSLELKCKRSLSLRNYLIHEFRAATGRIEISLSTYKYGTFFYK